MKKELKCGTIESMQNFWKELPKPFFVLAPMADVTDVAFREFIVTHNNQLQLGKPDVLYTEFISCKGLRSDEGRKALLRGLFYTEAQRPIVAQVFGNDPDDFLWCAQFIRKLGFDGIDVNMGCPVKKMVGQGAGASLLLDPPRARAIIRSLKAGAGDMPVSVKTRIGYDTINTEHWIGEILAEKPSALIVHLRTRKEMSKVPAHWEEMKKIVEMAKGTGTVLVGNGDVMSREEGEQRAKETGCDGIMIGRGVFGNPGVFQTSETGDRIMDDKKRLTALSGIIQLFDVVWAGTKPYDLLKKHYASYIRGFIGAKELRIKLMKTKNAKEALKILFFYLEKG